MKKKLMLAAVMILAFAMTACGGSKDSDKKEESKKEDNKKVDADAPMLYDLTDGTTHTGDELDVMFNYWADGFDASKTGKVIVNGAINTMDCNDDGVIDYDHDILSISVYENDQPVYYSISLFFDDPAKTPENGAIVTLEGVWQIVPTADPSDQSSYAICVTSVSE